MQSNPPTITGFRLVLRSKPIFGVTAANMRLLKWDAELAQMASVAAHSICLQRVIERKCEVTPSHLEPIGSTELALSADFKIELDAATVIDKWYVRIAWSSAVFRVGSRRPKYDFPER